MSTSFANKKNHNELLPSSIEAEQAVLGAILVDGEALHKVVEHIDSANFFYKRAHQLIYEAFLRLNEKSENIDILTASQYLKDQNQLEEIGGRSYLSALTDHAPIAANAPHYAKIIKAKSLLRNMILAGNQIVELGHQSEEDLDTLVDKAEQLIFNLSQSKSKDQLIHIGDLVHKSWKILEEREANKNQLSGLDTGYHDFNVLTSGLQKSDLLILAARPAMGKCLHKDSEIILEDGSLKTIEDIYKSQNAKILTLDTNWNFKFTKPSAFIDDGIKPIFEVKTKTGRSIKTTLSHPYLTIEGWKKLAELQVGDKVAVPRIINVFGQERLRDCEAKLLGLTIGNNSLEGLEFTVEQEITTQDIQLVANTLNTSCQMIQKNPSKPPISIEKIPEDVFQLPKEQLALFINRLFSANNWTGSLNINQTQISLISQSQTVVKQIQHLLLRFGIISSIHQATTWQLDITEHSSIKTFIEEIGIFTQEEALNTINQQLKLNEPNKNTQGDIYWDQIVSIEHHGSEQVYDLTIAETHNFVANDICVHNTSLALNIAENVAINTKKPVALFSLEMSKEQLVQRLLCSRAEVDSSRVRSGQLHADDWARLGTAMSELGEAPLYLDDSGGVSVMELRGKCRRLQAMTNGELGLVVIDYLQLLEGRSNDTRINQISEISRGLKMMARELNVPVMALSQLSRAVESRQDKRPMLSDLRDSGSIEQDADIVVFIYRDDYYNPESEKAGIADVIIAKHRSGPVGVVELLFQSNITKFKNPAPGY
ncbi:MAG: replicative DNA helicase [Cyanobacteria bacterium]|nr:replicative DNA helicase [Cyanobacteriota bacterium]MDA1020871.1 replicative DNA helicase [Cyanobacteriota bacterium]